MTDARLALLRVYAALDQDPDHSERSEKPLAGDLQGLGLDMSNLRTVEEELKGFAAAVVAERLDTSAERPIVARVRVAETAMDIAALRDTAIDEETFRTLGQWLVSDEHRERDDVIGNVVAALRQASGAEDRQDRWTEVRRRVGLVDGESPLHEELRGVRRLFCHDEVREIDGEFATTITTIFDLVETDRTLDQLAAACMPPNWGACNDFFCSLTHLPDRNGECPPTGADPPRSDAADWRTVYEERVLVCPDGAFPDTFLLFTWSRRPTQLVLQYELAPPRPGEHPRLALDEGSIQIDRLLDGYRVTTTKLLLFHDKRLPSGGQTLGKYACELGWLDHSIAMFTGCANKLPSQPDEPEKRVPGPDERLLGVVTRCEGHARHRAEAVVKEADACLADLRAGTSGVDKHFTTCAQKATTWTAGDAARWVEGQLDYAVASIDLAQDLVTKWRRARA